MCKNPLLLTHKFGIMVINYFSIMESCGYDFSFLVYFERDKYSSLKMIQYDKPL